MASDDTRASDASSPRTTTLLLILAALVVTVLVITFCVLALRTPATAATAAAGWTASPGERTAASMSLSPCLAPPAQPAAELVGEQRGVATLSVRPDENGDTLTCLATQIDDAWTAITVVDPYDGTAPIPTDGAVVRSDALLQTDPTAVDAPRTPSQHVVSGEVGESVVGVTLQTAAGDTEATLSHGWFAAWWPTEDENELDHPVTVVLTLADGSTRTTALTAPAP